MKITRNFNQNLLNTSKIVGDIKSNISKSLIESGVAIKTNLVKEFKATNKTGKPNPNNRYGGRRSRIGQSLANDTGVSLSLIDSSKNGNSVQAGVKNNRNYKGGNYVLGWELKGRETLGAIIKSTDKQVDRIFDTNLRIK